MIGSKNSFSLIVTVIGNEIHLSVVLLLWLVGVNITQWKNAVIINTEQKNYIEIRQTWAAQQEVCLIKWNDCDAFSSCQVVSEMRTSHREYWPLHSIVSSLFIKKLHLKTKRKTQGSLKQAGSRQLIKHDLLCRHSAWFNITPVFTKWSCVYETCDDFWESAHSRSSGTNFWTLSAARPQPVLCCSFHICGWLNCLTHCRRQCESLLFLSLHSSHSQ